MPDVLRPIAHPAPTAANAAVYLARNTITSMPARESAKEHQRALLMMGHAVIDKWSAPELADHFRTSISTMNRRLAAFTKSGAVRRLEGREKQDANRHRLQTGGRASSRPPTLYGRGPNFLQWAAEIEQVRRGRLPERAGVRTHRMLKVHNVTLRCEIDSPPRIWLKEFDSIPFGSVGQIHHRRNIEVDGLTWRVVLWESRTKGFSTATITLAKESNPPIDEAQTSAFAVELWLSALRAKDALERTHGLRLIPMHPDRFFERIHAALGVVDDVEAWLSALPLESRRWRTIDGRLIWADASDGPTDLESHLPDAQVLAPMETALAWALKDPDSLNRLTVSVEAILERLEAIEAALARSANGSTK